LLDGSALRLSGRHHPPDGGDPYRTLATRSISNPLAV
jgi:hypothetical protein